MDVEQFKQLSALMERVIHKYDQIESRPRDWGSGIPLSRPEIHTVMLLAGEPGISVTAVAKRRGITKGAASQMLYKLVDKGLVDKRTSPDSDAQVSLFLTPQGQRVNERHNEYHRTAAQPLYEYLRSLPEDTFQALVGVMEHFDAAMDEQL